MQCSELVADLVVELVEELAAEHVEELVTEHVEELVVTLTNNFLPHAVHSYDAPQQWIVLLKDFLENEVAVTIFQIFSSAFDILGSADDNKTVPGLMWVILRFLRACCKVYCPQL